MNNTNPIIEFINHLESEAICYELDSIIDSLEELKEQEEKDEQYFKQLFASIFYEQQPLHA